MADIWILCKKENGVLTAVGFDTTEAAAKDLAQDGDYVVIPANAGRRYPNVIDEAMIGATPYTAISLYTVVQQAKAAIQSINDDIDQIKAQGQQIIADIQALDDRVTALEGG